MTHETEYTELHAHMELLAYQAGLGNPSSAKITQQFNALIARLDNAEALNATQAQNIGELQEGHA